MSIASCRFRHHVDSYRARHPGGGGVRGLRLTRRLRPQPQPPAIAASLCSRLRHHYASNVDNYGLKRTKWRHKNVTPAS